MKYDAIVIGAGPNGLTAGAILAKRGKKVLIVESAKEIGGHTRTIEFAPGFRAPLSHDGGVCLPNVARALGLGLPMAAHDVAFSVAALDSTLLTVPTTGASGIERHSRKDAEYWPKFVAQFATFADVLSRVYQIAPADIDTTSLGEVLPLALIGLKVRSLGRADMTEFLRVPPMSVQDLVDDAFESELLRAAVASFGIRDMRQGPRSGGTTFNLLHHMVGAGRVGSRPWSSSGPDAFAAAAASVAKAAGAELRVGGHVVRIVVKNDAVSGVVLGGGEEISAPTIISTADPKRTLLDLVEPQWLDPEIGHAVQNIKLRGCTGYVMFATDAPLPAVYAAPVSLTSSTVDLEKAADAAKYGEISSSPHVEIWSPSLRWPSLAPQGKHVVVARAQFAPSVLKTGVWTSEDFTALGKKVAAAIARVIPKFESTVTARVLFPPIEVEKVFGVTEGALTQGEMTLDQIMFMRPIPGWGRYAMPIRGLFLGGAGAHPGPGILGGAGLLAARAALK